MRLAVPLDRQTEFRGERVDDGDADPVQAAGNLIGIVLELSAGVKLGHDDLGRRNAFLGMNIHRNAATVIRHSHRTVAVELNRDAVAMARHGLVDGVVHDLEDHMVQAGAVIGVADIHTGSLADSVESAQHLDGISAVFLFRRCLGDRFAHLCFSQSFISST